MNANPKSASETAWDSLWLNLHIATMMGGYGVIEDAAVAIRDGVIAWVGRKADLPAGEALVTHDAKGLWMTPGLMDCHTHLIYAGDRANEFAARQKGATYAEIAKAGGGIMATVRATRAASEAALVASAARRLEALLQEGVTTIEIKSGYGLDLASERTMLRVARALGQAYPVTVRTTFLGAHAVPPDYAGRADDYITHLCETMLPALASEGLVDAVDGFCEHIGFSASQMERLFVAAQQSGLPVKLHAEQLSDQGGAALAARCGALSADHLEYVSAQGIAAMAQAGTVAVLLPGAFYMLRETQKPPVAALREAGVKMALATDCNPGTSPITSLLAIMNMGCVLFGLTPEEALAATTCHAAHALGMASTIGTIEVGKQADCALWEIAHPDVLSYQLGARPCVGVIKHGHYYQPDQTTRYQ